MKPVLLDTNVLSYAIRRDTRFAWYANELRDCEPCVSFMTIAELYLWADVRGWGGRRRSDLDTYLSQCHAIYVDLRLCRAWSSLMAECRGQGRKLPIADAWIAATALEHSLPLFTHNRKHFEFIQGLTIVSSPDVADNERADD